MRDGFGEDVNIYETLIKFIEASENDNYLYKDGFHRRYVLRDLYVKLYRLHAERGVTGTALDVITMTNKEGHWRLGPSAKRMLDYRICKIKDKFGLSYLEFINQPRYDVLEQIEISLREINDDNSRANEESNLIDGLMKQFSLGPEMRGDLVNVLKKNK